MAIQEVQAEQTVNLLRQIEVRIAKGKPTPQACKEAKSRYRPTTAGGKNTVG